MTWPAVVLPLVSDIITIKRESRIPHMCKIFSKLAKWLADELKKKNYSGAERQFPIRPFLFDSLLFDGATPSPLCARAVPLSNKQLPANDTQMATEFVAAAALGVTFRNFLALRPPYPKKKKKKRSNPGGSLTRLGTPGCCGAGLIGTSRRSVPREPMGRRVTWLSKHWQIVSPTNWAACAVLAHAITGADCFTNSSPGPSSNYY